MFNPTQKVGQSGETSWWKGCYRRGLPRLVENHFHPFGIGANICTRQKIQCFLYAEFLIFYFSVFGLFVCLALGCVW